MAAQQASKIFKAHVKGVNIMTPHALGHGFIGTRWVYEVTEGTGMFGEPIYGVTVIDKTTGNLVKDAGGLFDRKEAAYEWVALMKEEQQ